jgi:hypothetical protein
VKRLSDGRIEALALAIVGRLEKQRDFKIADRGVTLKLVANRLKEAFQVDSELDRAVRARIGSLHRPVPEGSREWELLYRQYLDELSRRGPAGRGRG